MTKALIQIEPELWKQARTYAITNDLTVNELVTLALERLLMPVAGRTIEPEPYPLKTNSTVAYDLDTIKRVSNDFIVEAGDLQAMTPTRPTPPLAGPSFGSSRPAPKPMRKTR